MAFYALIKYWFAPNDWHRNVVPAVWCICSFSERKLIYSYPNNSRHLFFQPNCKCNTIECEWIWQFFRRPVGSFSSKFRPKLWFSFFLSKILNFAISFVFRLKWISCVPTPQACPTMRQACVASRNHVTGSFGSVFATAYSVAVLCLSRQLCDMHPWARDAHPYCSA